MRKFSYTLCVLFLALAFWGCNSDWLNGKTQSVTFDGSSYFLPVDSDTTTLVLSGVKGHDLSCVVVNTSTNAISSRYIVTDVIERSSLSEEESFSETQAPEQEGIVRIDYNPQYPEPNLPESASRSAQEVNANTSVEKTFTVGDTKKFYAPTDENLSVWTTQIDCTLRAVGTDDGEIICYVWVDDKAYTDSAISSGSKINTSMAEKLADTFAKHKKEETALMGEESDSVFYVAGPNSKKTVEPMENFSETGTKVNIVVYDIGGDFKKTKESASGTLGFFSSKDYWIFDKPCFTSKSVRYDIFGDEDTASYYESSNRGKVFYCDSAFCNYNSDAFKKSQIKDTWWVPKDNSPSGDMVSTMFHEFQHMICYGNKKIKNSVTASTWSNEMMSMLVEDVLREKLEVDTSSAPSETRLPDFNKNYFWLGADTWLSGEDAVYSYSSAYAFGAWLVRNYGGAELLHEMSVNEYADWESIVAAVKTVTGIDVTRKSLLIEWAFASCFRPTYAQEKSLPTYYETPDDYTSDGTTYSFEPINLFSEAYKWTYESESTGGKKETRYGPALVKKQRYDLPAGGFAHMWLGTASDDSYTFSLPRWSNSGEKIYILVHDDYDALTKDRLGE